MTNKEAIFVLKKELDGIPSDIDKSAFEKAVDLAIKALEREENLEQAVQPRTTEDNSAVVRGNLTSDLISRSELKKVLLDAYEEYDGYDPNDLRRFAERVDDEIDNAPTVEAYTNDDIQQAIQIGYKVGFEAGQTKFERPRGEWIPQTAYDGFTYWKCSECGKKNDFAVTDFCFHCGADMRKGGAK